MFMCPANRNRFGFNLCVNYILKSVLEMFFFFSFTIFILKTIWKLPFLKAIMFDDTGYFCFLHPINRFRTTVTILQ